MGLIDHTQFLIKPTLKNWRLLTKYLKVCTCKDETATLIIRNTVTELKIKRTLFKNSVSKKYSFVNTLQIIRGAETIEIVKLPKGAKWGIVTNSNSFVPSMSETDVMNAIKTFITMPKLIDHVKFFHTGTDEDLHKFLAFVSNKPSPDKITLTEGNQIIGGVYITVQNNGNVLLMIKTQLNKGLHLAYMGDNLFKLTNLIFTNEQFYSPFIDNIDFKTLKNKLLYGFQNIPY